MFLPLDYKLAIEASRIKVVGDEMLRESRVPEFRTRRLSISDATTIALALKLGKPIVTGDKDLEYIAKSLGVEIIW